MVLLSFITYRRVSLFVNVGSFALGSCLVSFDKGSVYSYDLILLLLRSSNGYGDNMENQESRSLMHPIVMEPTANCLLV